MGKSLEMQAVYEASQCQLVHMIQLESETHLEAGLSKSESSTKSSSSSSASSGIHQYRPELLSATSNLHDERIVLVKATALVFRPRKAERTGH